MTGAADAVVVGGRDHRPRRRARARPRRGSGRRARPRAGRRQAPQHGVRRRHPRRRRRRLPRPRARGRGAVPGPRARGRRWSPRPSDGPTSGARARCAACPRARSSACPPTSTSWPSRAWCPPPAWPGPRQDLAEPLVAPERRPGHRRGHPGRLGDEVADRLVDPLVGGINAGATDALSLAATVPQLDAAVRSGAAVADRGLPGPAGRPRPTRPRRCSSPPAAAWARITDALVADLRPRGVELRPDGRPARSSGSATGWRVVDDDGRGLDADGGRARRRRPGVAASLLRPHAARAATLLAAIPYASVALVSLAVERPAHRPRARRQRLPRPAGRGPHDHGLLVDHSQVAPPPRRRHRVAPGLGGPRRRRRPRSTSTTTRWWPRSSPTSPTPWRCAAPSRPPGSPAGRARSRSTAPATSPASTPSTPTCRRRRPASWWPAPPCGASACRPASARAPPRPDRLRPVAAIISAVPRIPDRVRTAAGCVAAGAALCASLPPVRLLAARRRGPRRPRPAHRRPAAPRCRFRRGLARGDGAASCPSLFWMHALTLPGLRRGLRAVRGDARGRGGRRARPDRVAGRRWPARGRSSSCSAGRGPSAGVPLASLAVGPGGRAPGPGRPGRRGPPPRHAHGRGRPGDRRRRAPARGDRPARSPPSSRVALVLAAVAPRGHDVGSAEVALVQGGGAQGTRMADTDPAVPFENHVEATAAGAAPGRPHRVARGRHRHDRAVRRGPVGRRRRSSWRGRRTRR